MTPYLLVLIISLTTYAVIIWLVKSNRLSSIAYWINFLGTCTAFLALFVSQMLSFWHALIIIFGLSFASAVLLAKQQEAK